MPGARRLLPAGSVLPALHEEALTREFPTRFPDDADLPWIGLLRRDGAASAPSAPAEAIFARAERHGLAGVLRDAWGEPLPPSLESSLTARAVARELAHEAHLELLERVDEAMAAASIPAVVLKGPLFAERFYAHPSVRGTSDVDLLVEERRVEDSIRAVAAIGYAVANDAHAEWSRREHHHIVLVKPRALPLELHFRAYHGFGETLHGEPLIARAGSAGARFRSLRVLAPEDELVYLAVHAAAHRFGRIGWLYDIVLLLDTMAPDAIARAASRAREAGYGRALAMAGLLLVEVLGVDRERARLLGHVGAARAGILRAIVGEPPSPVLRSATRFVYSALLADSLRASLRYGRIASRQRLASALDRARQRP